MLYINSCLDVWKYENQFKTKSYSTESQAGDGFELFCDMTLDNSFG